jgi:hypothetical protein
LEEIVSSSTRNGTWILENILALGLTTLVVGCSSQGKSLEEIAASQSNDSTIRVVEFDAGVVYSDQASYQCVLFDRLGLSNESELHVVKTSCDCLDARVVQIPLNQHQHANAFLLNFSPTPKKRAAECNVSKLAVVITLNGHSKDEIELVVKLLHVDNHNKND